jgi:hypothetical protein
MIRLIIEEAGLTIREGNVVDLGYENSWYYSEKTRAAYKQLMPFKKSATSKTIGRCVTQTVWTLHDGLEEFTLVSAVDSSD